jgi:hypothetical protein
MSQKDRERWKSMLSNKSTGDDLNKVKAITYEMELALGKIDA